MVSERNLTFVEQSISNFILNRCAPFASNRTRTKQTKTQQQHINPQSAYLPRPSTFGPNKPCIAGIFVHPSHVSSNVTGSSTLSNSGYPFARLCHLTLSVTGGGPPKTGVMFGGLFFCPWYRLGMVNLHLSTTAMANAR